MLKESKKTFSKPSKLRNNDTNSHTWYDMSIVRGISENTLLKYDIRCTNEAYYFPFYYNSKHVSTKKLLFKRKDGKKIIQFEKDCMPCLFGLNTVNDKSDILNIFEGEIDAMSAYEMGMHSCVSVPMGTGGTSWIEHNFEYLKRFKEIYICFDADKAGREGAEALRIRLGDRAKIVNIANTEKLVDVNDLLKANKKDFLKKRFNEAKHPIARTVIDFNDVIESKVAELEEGSKSIASTNFENVDKDIFGRGGIRASEVTVLTGSPGSGKSEFVNNLAINVAQQGNSVFIASFEQEINEQSALMSHVLTGEELLSYDEIVGRDKAKKFQRVKDNLKRSYNWCSDHNLLMYGSGFLGDGMKKEKVLESMKYCFQRYGTKLFIIDSITLMISSDNTKNAEETKELMQIFQRFAKTYKVHILCVAHPRKLSDKSKIVDENDLYGSVMMMNFINNLISLWRFRKSSGDDRVYCENFESTMKLYCFKNRKRGYCRDRHVNLAFDTDTKRYSEIMMYNGDKYSAFVNTREPVFMEYFVNHNSTMSSRDRKEVMSDYNSIKNAYERKEE